MKSILFTLLYSFAITIPWQPASEEAPNLLAKNGMTIGWHHEQSFVRFELAAPTNGWLAIGFNEQQRLDNTYLIMAKVEDGYVNVTEHKVLRPGQYIPVIETNGKSMIFDCQGYESGDSTHVSFSVPTGLGGEFQKDLSPSLDYYLTIAFSRSDDFQHHSIMRTQTSVKL